MASVTATHPPSLAAVLAARERVTAAARAAGRAAAARDRTEGTRTPAPASVDSDRATARRVAVAWWDGYAEEWPGGMTSTADTDMTGAVTVAADTEPRTAGDLTRALPNR